MPRIFVYDGRAIPDPDPALSVDEVRQSLVPFFHELANATHTERQEGETTYVEFRRQVGTKGAPTCKPSLPLPNPCPRCNGEVVQDLTLDSAFCRDCGCHYRFDYDRGHWVYDTL